MKIKRSTWHCKISNLGKDWEKTNDNLCSYFWRLIIKSIALIIGIPVIIAFIVGGIYTIVSDPPTLIVFLFFGSSVTFPILAIYFLRNKIGKAPEMPYGNIVTEYIKAKKEKVCPLIKYIN